MEPNADAATSMPPLRARRSTSSISGSDPFFGTNADAPAWVARSTHCGSRCAVTTTMTRSGRTSRSRRVAASPSWRGISMSMTTRSGFGVSAAIATASAALPAVPTHCRSGSDDSASDSRSANVWWSSTTITRNGAATVVTHCRRHALTVSH